MVEYRRLPTWLGLKISKRRRKAAVESHRKTSLMQVETMGNCATIRIPEGECERLHAENIDQQLALENRQNKNVIQLLLLGAGDSGKSTILKQIKQIYGAGFNDEQRRLVKPIIASNLIGGTQLLIENSAKLGLQLSNPLTIKAAKVLLSCTDDRQITAKIAKAIRILWNDQNIKQTFKSRQKFHLFDCYQYFANSISKNYPQWGGPTWTPSMDDVLRSRSQSKGIVETSFSIDRINFKVFDVGGQRNERRKWINCFDGVTAVIFVASISEYDQPLFEDETQNRFVESVSLFREVCNSPWFIDTSIILLLNKTDVFKSKFIDERIDLNTTGLPIFDTWKSVQWKVTTKEKALDKAYRWLLKQFISQRNHQTEIYHHFTCATDKKNISTVLNLSKEVIFKHELRNSGFLGRI